MKIISVILARGGSKGIPKKNIIDLNKEPLISYTIKTSFWVKNRIQTSGSTFLNLKPRNSVQFEFSKTNA